MSAKRTDQIPWEADPEFDAWVKTLPEKTWAKTDLSACRLGWEARKAAQMMREREVGKYDALANNFVADAIEQLRLELGELSENCEPLAVISTAWARVRRLKAEAKGAQQEAGGADVVAWVFPRRYGSGVQFPKPVKPEGWDDDDQPWFLPPADLCRRRARGAEMSPLCPQCSQPLNEVRYPSDCMLNRDQWEPQIAGNWYCTHCEDNGRGNTGYAYFWDSEVKS